MLLELAINFSLLLLPELISLRESLTANRCQFDTPTPTFFLYLAAVPSFPFFVVVVLSASPSWEQKEMRALHVLLALVALLALACR